jgi:phosphoglycerate dehydrogenase-like enzyme
MKVVAFDPNRNIEEPYVTQMPSHREVLEDADIVMVCVHLDETTRNMVNKQWFERMKNGVYFINTSRGEIVDEDALLEALENGKVRAAAVDVITSEMTSNKKEHPMIRYASHHDNLLVTPHIAGLTVDSEYKAAQRTFEFLKQVLEGAK